MENILEFNPNFVFKDWCNDELIYLEDVENYKFYNKEVYHEKFKVPLSNVIGTKHWGYAGRTWLDLPYNMKRFHKDYNINSFLNFYKSDSFFNNDISYAKFGDNFFITGGNHRTCQAKFSDIEYIETFVTEHIFDQEMYGAFKFLKSENLNPEILSQSGKYYRFNNWVITINNQSFHFKEFNQVKFFIELYQKSKPNFYKKIYHRFFKKELNGFFREDEEINNLTGEIILHKLKTFN